VGGEEVGYQTLLLYQTLAHGAAPALYSKGWRDLSINSPTSGESAMTADSERLLHARCRPYPWVSLLGVLCVCMAILTVAVGGMALVAASPLRQIIESLVNIHLLFAVLLCTLLITRYDGLLSIHHRFASTRRAS
jgi:hypothetical protein